MAEENVKIPALSSKATDLLKRLENLRNFDEPPNDSIAQSVESMKHKSQITWVIKKKDLNKTGDVKFLRSPIVEIDLRSRSVIIPKCKLWLEIYPIRDPSHADIKICFDKLPENVHILCNISLKDNNQQNIWEEDFSGSSCDLIDKKIPFSNFFFGVNERKLSSEEFFQIECLVKLFSNLYACKSRLNYTVNGSPVINNYMESILNSEELSDVDLVVGSTDIKSHKCILASESPALKILFKLNYGKKQELQNEDPATFKDVLRYIYTGDIKIDSQQHVRNLYVTAHKYELDSLKNLCSVYLNANLSKSNISDMFDLSRRHDDKYLFTACLEFIKENTIDLSVEAFLKQKCKK